MYIGRYYTLIIGLILLVCCVSEYEPNAIDQIEGLLVVEGMITNDTAEIRLSRSVKILDDFGEEESITDANVFVECDQGFTFKPVNVSEEGVYIIKVDKLDPAYKYRLSINWNDKEYKSEYLSPLDTPAIDSVSVESPASEKPVYICVTTHDNELEPTYYKWSYREIWEFNADLFANAGYLNDKFYMFERHTSQNTYYCWGRDSSKVMLLATTDKLTENLIYEKELIEIPRDHDKLKILYYIEVQQNRIRKEAYEYFKNIQRNIEQTGSIFSPIPTEVRGNIACVSDPEEWVLGYVDVTNTTIMKRFMPELRDFYETSYDCAKKILTGMAPDGYTYYIYSGAPTVPNIYAPFRCVDCTYDGRGTKNKPSWWPTDHL